MSTNTIKSRIACPITRHREARLPILAFFASVVADAATTVYGISIMGTVFEGGPLASKIIPWLWTTSDFGLNLGEAAGIYVYGYIAIGLIVAVVLELGDRHIQAVPGGRWFAPSLAFIFATSSVINIVVLAKWIAWVPNAGWM